MFSLQGQYCLHSASVAPSIIVVCLLCVKHLGFFVVKCGENTEISNFEWPNSE